MPIIANTQEAAQHALSMHDGYTVQTPYAENMELTPWRQPELHTLSTRSGLCLMYTLVL